MFLFDTWTQENATDRFDFLFALSHRLTADDIAFLEKVRQDKSKKVSELALQQLIKLPESRISREIGQRCSLLLTVKEGGIFGMGQKTISVNAEIDLLPLVEELGLEKESLHKTFSDQEYQAFQLISLINPGFWEKQLSLTSEKILKQFITNKGLKKYIPAFAQAILLHKNNTWAATWLQNMPGSGTEYEQLQNDIYQIFPIAPQETISELIESQQIENFIASANLIEILCNLNFPWSMKFSKTILQLLYRHYANRGVYHYEMNKFLEISQYLHSDILQNKNEFLPAGHEKRETWRTMIEDLFRNIELKTNIQTSFDA